MATRNDVVSDCRSALTDKYCWGIWCACVCYTILLLALLGTFPPEIPGSEQFILSGLHWSGQNLRRSGRLIYPAQYVVVTQAGSAGCSTVRKCSKVMHTLLNHSDVGYSFVVAGDGNVYEGRGWGSVAANTGHLAACSLSLALLGDFREVEPKDLQLQALQQLVKLGVNYSKIAKDYKMVTPESDLPSNLLVKLEKMQNYCDVPSEELRCKE